MKIPHKQLPVNFNLPVNTILPADKNQLAYYSISQQAFLIKNKKINSGELTRFFLARLRKYAPTLHCAIEITEGIAIREAKKADVEIAKGIYKGPLHGIPYGIKDRPEAVHRYCRPPCRRCPKTATCMCKLPLSSANGVRVNKQKAC